MHALVVSGKAFDLMFYCHLAFIVKVGQTLADMYTPTELDFVIHGEDWLTWYGYDDDDEI